MTERLIDPIIHIPITTFRPPRHMADMIVAVFDESDGGGASSRRFGVTFSHKVPKLPKGESPQPHHNPITTCVVSIIHEDNTITPFVDGKATCHLCPRAGSRPDQFNRAVGRKRALATALRKVTESPENRHPVEALTKLERDIIWRAVFKVCRPPGASHRSWHPSSAPVPTPTPEAIQ